MSENITKLVLEYRDSMRQLWNSHAQRLDGKHRFNKIEQDYFHYAVLFQTINKAPDDRHKIENYYEYISVKPICEGYLGRFLLGKENSQKGHDFEFIDLTKESALELRFISFFDLTGNVRREYKYVKAYILNSNIKELIGCVVLIDAECAEYKNVYIKKT